jgi:hypothetical protein
LTVTHKAFKKAGQYDPPFFWNLYSVKSYCALTVIPASIARLHSGGFAEENRKPFLKQGKIPDPQTSGTGKPEWQTKNRLV